MNSLFTGFMNITTSTSVGIHTLFIVGSACQESKGSTKSNELSTCRNPSGSFRHCHNTERGLEKIANEAVGVFKTASIYAIWSKILTKAIKVSNPKALAVEFAATWLLTTGYALNRANATDDFLQQKVIEKI